METKKWNGLLFLTFCTFLLTLSAVTPSNAEQPDKMKACQLYECQKKAAEYTYNLDKAGDKELFDQHLSNCMKLSPPEKCLPKPLLKMSVGDPSTIILPPNPGADPADLEIKDNKTYVVSSAGTYRYRFINIHSGGKLVFQDGKDEVHFWAKSILVENKGTLQIGTQDKPITDRIITLNLYGSDKDNLTITCKSSLKDDNQCGVPLKDYWKSSPDQKWKDLPDGEDYFYAYDKLITDDNPVNLSGNSQPEAYFGRKVIAVSYGGTLLMFGKKGVDNSVPDSSSGKSWARLDGSIKPGDSTLKVDRELDWQQGDSIVVTTTDFLPGHSEKFTIQEVKADKRTIVIEPKSTDPPKYVAYPHNGQKFDLSKRNIPSNITTKQDVETRAAVALLSRNIRIVSGGVNPGDPLPDEKSQDTDRYFGGHLIVRQGFKQFQMQGVELYQMGQGGRMAHVPINFFLTRKVPDNTFVKDCSIWDSMNHWIELRGTQNVTLQRNVGYKSIGHGFVLADGTEADNNLLANIGIYARPGLDYPDNPRKVPGVLALRTLKDNKGASVLSHTLAYGGDAFHPSPFFVMNAYNTINFNMASGAGACGSCYWFAPAHIGLFSKNKKWEGMAGILDVAPGGSIIKSFSGNFCSTAMYSLITVADSEQCWGIGQNPNAENDAFIPVIANPLSSKYINTCSEENIENCIVPNGDNGQQSDGAAPFIPPPAFTSSNVSLVKEKACTVSNSENCGVNVIDSYTSSFNFANKNFSAIWLRTFWFLFTDSFVSDVLSGGLTMVSGGSYDQVPTGYWGLTRKSVFVGSTQPANDFATPSGPRIDTTTSTGLSCDGPGAYCLLKNKDNQYEGISFPTGSFGNYQRLVNIYDGPVYLDAVAFLDVKKTVLDTCTSPKKVSTAPPETMPAQQCDSTGLIYGKFRSFPIPVDKDDPNYKAFDKNNPDDFAKNSNKCILPNAAIGWKQPNGFYYPPAFHMRNLYFNNVDIRHYVVVPPFNQGQMQTDYNRLTTEYCAYDSGVFNDFTDIDRQTEINDDDGTLSGISLLPDPTGNAPKNFQFTGSISVNNDSFFYTPIRPFECLSQQTCLQVPYDQLNLAVIPTNYTATDDQKKAWALDCSIKKCAGTLIYRQYRLSDTIDPQGDMQGIRMMGTQTGQRSVMLANKGKYFIDTALRENTQDSNFNTHFKGGQSYKFFLLFAKPESEISLQLYVGKNFNKTSGISAIRVNSKDLVSEKTTPSSAITWPETWSKEVDANGILTVSMKLKDVKPFKDAEQESCQPSSYCRWDAINGKCVVRTYPDSQFPLSIGYKDNDPATCTEWAVKTPECPSGGCYGFKITFPDDFDSDPGVINRNAKEPIPIRPATELFPASWNNPQFFKDKGLAECNISNLTPKAYISPDINGATRFEVTQYNISGSPETMFVNTPGGTIIRMLKQVGQDTSYADESNKNSLTLDSAGATLTLDKKGAITGKLATVYLSSGNDNGRMELVYGDANQTTAYLRLPDARWFTLSKESDGSYKTGTFSLILRDKNAIFTCMKCNTDKSDVILFNGNRD